MKKSILLALPIMSSLLFGCASTEYVNHQLEPIVERMNKLEQDAKETRSLAQEAMKTANDCRTKVAADAKKSEAAAERAESEAKKCEKAFELHQQK